MNTFIHKDYKENITQNQYVDIGETDKYQKEVYEASVKIYNDKNFSSVVDLGCGSAYKLLNYFPESAILIGIEEELTYKWLLNTYPKHNWLMFTPTLLLEPFDILICSDVIEHIVKLEEFVKWIVSQSWKIGVFSTPDRVYYEGPPINTSHVREWNFEEFESFMSQWFEIIDHVVRGQATQIISVRKHT